MARTNRLQSFLRLISNLSPGTCTSLLFPRQYRIFLTASYTSHHPHGMSAAARESRALNYRKGSCHMLSLVGQAEFHNSIIEFSFWADGAHQGLPFYRQASQIMLSPQPDTRIGGGSHRRHLW